MNDGPASGAVPDGSGLSPVVLGHRCIVCVGPGGVGKTSTAAALGMFAAAAGKRTVVLTIDPARRLANALGLSEIGSLERPVPSSAFEAAGLTAPPGQLTAMMLDIKEAWDDVIHRYHPDPERRARLLENPLYQAMSTALAGSQEYMAMEKLHALASREDDPLDVIIVDTPPANHAVDFLEAPSRLIGALDNDATRWLMEPYVQGRGGLSRRLFGVGSSFFIRSISKFIGTEMLEDLAELLVSFQGMFDGFRDRAKAVSALLADTATTFVVVSSPSSVGVQDAEAFAARLSDRGLNVGGVVLNRSTPDPGTAGTLPDLEAVRDEVQDAGGQPEWAETLYQAAAGDHARAKAERAAALALSEQHPGVRVVTVPAFPEDVHDMKGLARLRDALAADGVSFRASESEPPGSGGHL